MMDFSSSSALLSVKERMREKLNRTLKAVKLQTSLAAKIKTKTLNNSSILKVSLKLNNKALACALTAEREKSRRLGKEKMLLQKEVKMLHFQNALLRQNLRIVNEMLKEIDVCMKNNLPAAIEISRPMESSDRQSLKEGMRASERVSQQGAPSLDDDQGFRLIGKALRVPSNGVQQQKPTGHLPILVNEETTPLVSHVLRENRDKLEEPESHRSSPNEHLSVCNENGSRDSFSKMKVIDNILPLDEVFSPSSRKAQSGGFVTRRKKRSTLSPSNMVSKSSAANLTRVPAGTRRESCPGTQWEMTAEITLLPEPGHTEESQIDSVLQKDRLSTASHCPKLSQHLDTCPSSDVGRTLSDASCQDVLPGTSQLEVNEGRAHHTVDGCVAQETTVYEADMEMTSSESNPVIAVLPKKKTQASKTKRGIPVKETSTLRKVKRMDREKTKRTQSSVAQQVNDSSNSDGDPAEKSIEQLRSDRHYDRRTYILPRSVVEGRLDVLESGAQSDLEVSASGEFCGMGQIFPNNTIELNGENSKLALDLQIDHCTEVGDITDAAPKRRSKSVKERSRKKKRNKNSNNQEQVSEVACSVSTENSSYSVSIQKPKIRRETYVIGATDPARSSLVSKLHGINYRRETFVIPEPDPLVSVNLKTSAFEVRNGTFEQLQKDVNSLGVTNDSQKTENRSDADKERCDAVANAGNACAYKKRVSRHSEKTPSADLFSQLDERKTQTLSNKQDDFRDEGATLVRDSLMNPTWSQNGNAILCPDFTGNENELFLLNMVSESILDHTGELSSLSEFPSATNPEDVSTINTSLKSVPAAEPPGSEDSNNESPQASPNINVPAEKDSGHQPDTLDSQIGSDQHCKVEDPSMEIHEAGIKPFQDLTNKSLGSPKQSPNFYSEERSCHNTRRRGNPVNYKEPNLGSKLRRGDNHTNTEFLYSPVAKEKTKPRRKQNNVKSKTCRMKNE